MRKSEQDFIVEQVNQVNGTVLAADSDDIDNRALHHDFDLTLHSELVNPFMLDDVPELHLFASIEKHLVNIGDRVNYSSEVFILKLSSFHNFASLCVKSKEFSLLAEWKNQIRGDKELQYGLFVTFINCMSMHFVPRDNLICLPQRGVNQSRSCRLKIGDLFCNKPTHKDDSQLGRTVDIERILSNDCGQKRVLSAFIDTEGHRAGVVSKRTVWFE